MNFSKPPTVHLPLYLCFSIVTTAASLYRTCFVLAKAEKLKEELTNCLYFGLEFQFLWGRRISEFGLKQRLSSSSSLVKSHRKGNCTHNHYLSYHNKLSYQTTAPLPQFFIKAPFSLCLSLCLLFYGREGDCSIKMIPNFAFAYVSILCDLFSFINIGQTVKL